MIRLGSWLNGSVKSTGFPVTSANDFFLLVVAGGNEEETFVGGWWTAAISSKKAAAIDCVSCTSMRSPQTEVLHYLLNSSSKIAGW